MADGSYHPDIYSIDQWIDIMVGSERRGLWGRGLGKTFT
jgi:hypothetical protein